MQKTAYEVRISDWSSDVCSSDLIEFRSRPQDIQRGLHHVIARAGKRQVDDAPLSRLDALFAQAGAGFLAGRHHIDAAQGKIGRASCRESEGHYLYIVVVVGSLNKKITEPKVQQSTFLQDI